MKRRSSWLATTALMLLGPLTGCGERDPKWSSPAVNVESIGLTGAVVVTDVTQNRILLVTTPRPDEIAVEPIKVGRNLVALEPSPDLERLFVLSKGVQPRLNPEDELPQLMVVDGAPDAKKRVLERFSLGKPMTKLAIDPQGDWVAAFGGDSTVTNPNELALFSLDGDGQQRSKTIRSFGGYPAELTFTEPLTMPSGSQRRFLIVRTDRDITLVDLDDLDRDEITVQLPLTPDGEPTTPLEVVVTDGEPDVDDDARLAVRLEGQSDVLTLEFGTPSKADKDFALAPNIIDAGGVPSAIDFVHTNGGLRLAALVPSRQMASLVDLDTTYVETVKFALPYTSMTRITQDLSTADTDEVDEDVALLWSETAAGIAFWSLGTSSDEPFRSVDANDIDFAVDRVIDVPAPNRHLKLLTGDSASSFFVLDLEKRQTFPMLTSRAGFDISIAPDGERFWAFDHGTGEFSCVNFDNLDPTSLAVRLGVTAIHDVERADGTRGAVVLHGTDGESGSDIGVTLLDAEDPDSAKTRFFGGLLLTGY